MGTGIPEEVHPGTYDTVEEEPAARETDALLGTADDSNYNDSSNYSNNPGYSTMSQTGYFLGPGDEL